MKVLIYTRPRIDVFFKHLAENIPSFTQIVYFSDHPKTEQHDLMSYYYIAKIDIKKNEAMYEHVWKEHNLHDVVRRCRYLRMLNFDAALLKVKSMFLAVNRMIDIENPDYIFGMVMDSYVLDICDRLMRVRGSQYVGFLNNMLNGYSRLTSRGELIKNKFPGRELVDEKLSELKSKYYVPNMQKDFMWRTSPCSMFFTKYCKEKIKIIYYFFKKIIDSDPDNFYSNTVASKHCMSCRSVTQLFFRRFQDDNYQEFIDCAKNNKKKIVYLPLQFYPECSIDYWGTSKDMSDFYETVNLLLQNKYNNIVFLVKEHPSAYGLRKTEFYEKFQTNKSFSLVPFDISSNEIIEMADVVLTWTGSVGVESIIRNKPLVTLGEAYYKVDNSFREISKFEDILKIENVLLNAVESGLDMNTAFKVIENLLHGLVEGYVFPLDYGTSQNPYAESRMKILGENISELMLVIDNKGNVPVRDGTMY